MSHFFDEPIEQPSAPPPAAKPKRKIPWGALGWLLLALAVAGTMVVTVAVVNRQNQNAAEIDQLKANDSNNRKLIDEQRKQFEQCKGKPSTAAGCATPVAPAPTGTPPVITTGQNGQNGVGIYSVVCTTTGQWLVLLTDGRQISTGFCTGNPGKAGPTGDTGAKGEKGEKGDPGATGEKGESGQPGVPGEDSTVAGPKGDTGATGEPGSNGTDGSNGIGITSVTCNSDNRLIVVYSDDSSVDVGACGRGATGDTGPTGATGDPGAKGDTGDQGDKGSAGVSVTAIACSPDNRLLVTFSDSDTPKDEGPCTYGPSGPPGPSGPSGATGETGPKGDTGEQGRGIKSMTCTSSGWEITYDDDQVENGGPCMATVTEQAPSSSP